MPDTFGSPSKYQVAICTDARTAIHDGLKRLARGVNADPSAVRTIVDGLVEDVTIMRQREEEMRAKASEEVDPKAAQGWMLLASRYAELGVNAQCKMLDLGVKASNNEQVAIDRQMHVEMMVKGREPLDADRGRDEREAKARAFIEARNELVRARTKDAQFTTVREKTA